MITADDLKQIEIDAFRRANPSVKRSILFAMTSLVISLVATRNVPDGIFWVIRVGLIAVLLMAALAYWSRVRAERDADAWQRARAARLLREFRESPPAIRDAMRELGE